MFYNCGRWVLRRWMGLGDIGWEGEKGFGWWVLWEGIAEKK
jgi:hypothetical protein